MALPTIYLKNHEGVVQNSVGQTPIAPWWSAVRSESVYGQSLGQFNAFSLDYLRKEENHNVTKETGKIIKLDLHKKTLSGKQITDREENLLRVPNYNCDICDSDFLVFVKKNPDEIRNAVSSARPKKTWVIEFQRDFKVPKDGKKSPVDISFQSSLPENGARSDPTHLGPRKEMHAHVDRHYSDCCFGYFSAFGPQILGRVLLPFSLATDDGPTYVNAKQYHGILRRRISRAKAMKGRRQARARKPYLHESRHLHAMRRPRGCGGRFLKKITTKTTKADDSTRSESPASQNSEVFQADYKDRLNHSGSEATNMFLKENLSNLQINHRVLDLGHGLFVPAKWGII